MVAERREQARVGRRVRKAQPHRRRGAAEELERALARQWRRKRQQLRGIVSAAARGRKSRGDVARGEHAVDAMRTLLDMDAVDDAWRRFTGSRAGARPMGGAARTAGGEAVDDGRQVVMRDHWEVEAVALPLGEAVAKVRAWRVA